jgi:hypothetical protein
VFEVLTADSAILGSISNANSGRVTTTQGYGSFAISFANSGSSLVLTNFEPAPLTYEMWKTAFAFTTSNNAFSADADRDGLTNGLEYAMATNPTFAGSSFSPSISLAKASNGSGSVHLTLTYRRAAGVNRPTDLIWTVQRNTDLTDSAGWSDDGLLPEEVTPGPPGSDYEIVVVRSQSEVGAAGNPREFLRLLVTQM